MNTATKSTYLRPAATIIENDDAFVIEADLPGVTREGLSLTVENDTLTIVGKRGTVNHSGRALHRESHGIDYRRVFELGREIDRNRVEARFDQGVLRVLLGKADAMKPRRIEIRG